MVTFAPFFEYGMIATDKFTIVYSLDHVTSIDMYLPTAYICDIDGKNRPAYQRALCTSETIKSYIGNISDAEQNVLDLCYDLSIESLEKHFTKSKGKSSKLHLLFADSSLKNTVKSAIESRLLKFYNAAEEIGAYLVHNLIRKVKACDISLAPITLLAQPMLSFVKNNSGISYTLQLKAGEEIIVPSKRNILLLLDRPGIISVDRKIMRLDKINASKLKPFLTKQKIEIENKVVKTYFEKFIVDIIKHTDQVTAEGFNILSIDVFDEVLLQPFYHFFEKRWKIEVIFNYGPFKFRSAEKTERKSTIDLRKSDDIGLLVGIRNKKAESSSLRLLENLHFSIDDDGMLVASEGYNILEWLTDQKNALLAEGFKIGTFQYEDKVIALQKMIITENFTLQNDWFDLNGVVRINDEIYPFSALIQNIKNEDPWFALHDGTFVLIPVEYMAKYHDMSGHIQFDKSICRIAKVHHHLIPENSVNEEKGIIELDELDIAVPKTLKVIMRPYQVIGYKWLVAHRINGLGACLADDMGLGKTLQTIAALLQAKEEMVEHEENNNVEPIAGMQLDLFAPITGYKRQSLKALIVLPASLVFNWQAELLRFAPDLKSIKFIGAQRSDLKNALLQHDVIITTYQTALSDIDWLEQQSFSYVVLDESQYIRNRDAKIFKAVNKLKAAHKISLSGTPIENSLSDLWSQMEFINPSILGTFSAFQQQYKIPIEKHADKDALARLKKVIDPYILRRTKGQVAPDLPDLIEQIHYSDMTEVQSKLFEEEKSKARNQLLSLGKEYTKIHVLATILRLRQIANHPLLANDTYEGGSGKFDDLIAGISEVVNSGNKILVFSSFVEYLNIIGKSLKKDAITFTSLTGSDDSISREKAVAAFQKDESCQVFLISIKAGGTGLNLTAADYVFIVDPWWNPQVERQAIARAHRIGQSKTVFVTRFISTNSIEEKILKLQASKAQLADDLISTEPSKYLSDEDIHELLN